MDEAFTSLQTRRPRTSSLDLWNEADLLFGSMRKCTVVLNFVASIMSIIGIIALVCWGHLSTIPQSVSEIHAETDTDWTELVSPLRPPSVALVNDGVGLENPSLTSCYMNSALQCLRHLRPMNSFLSGAAIQGIAAGIKANMTVIGGTADVDSNRRKYAADCILEYCATVRQIDASELGNPPKRTIAATGFFGAICKAANFHPTEQQCIQEMIENFYQAVSTVLEEAPKAVSEVWRRLVEITSERVTRNIEGDGELVVEPASRKTILSLPLEKAVEKGANVLSPVELTHLLDLSFNVDDSREALLDELPMVLTIWIQRSDVGRKISNPVVLPLWIDLSPYHRYPGTCGPIIYDLGGVSAHLGKTTGSGHYVARVRSGSDADHEWLFCNDGKVVKTSQEDVLAGEGSTLLFYVRRERIPPTRP